MHDPVDAALMVMTAHDPARFALVLMAVLALGLVAGAARASAALSGPNCTWNPRYGCAWFDDHGDRFYVCDYNSDGNSVVVEYAYETRRGVKTGYAISRGNAVPQTRKGRDCPLDAENHAEGARFKAHVCMAAYAKPGGRPIDVLETTCGGWWTGRF